MTLTRAGLMCFAQLLGALTACTPRTDLDAARQRVMDTDRAFAGATAGSGVEGWVSHFATDGAMVRPGGLVVGHDSIRAFMGPAFADTSYSLKWMPHNAWISDGGDLAYTMGRYESRRRRDGEVVVGRGTYLTVWRKQRDGSWKVEADIGSPDGPPEPEP